MTRAVDAVVDVDDAPLPVQAIAVRAPIARAAAVVHVEHGDAAAGPVLHAEIEHAGRERGRAAMALDHAAAAWCRPGPRSRGWSAGSRRHAPSCRPRWETRCAPVRRNSARVPAARVAERRSTSVWPVARSRRTIEATSVGEAARNTASPAARARCHSRCREGRSAQAGAMRGQAAPGGRYRPPSSCRRSDQGRRRRSWTSRTPTAPARNPPRAGKARERCRRPAVEIPPAAAVGNEIQHPIRRPFRLKHGFVRVRRRPSSAVASVPSGAISATHSSVPTHGMLG